MQKRTIETYSGDLVKPDARRAGSDDDDISLMELWRVVRKRWAWPLGGLVCGALAAVTYATLATPVYQSRASIQIGKVHDKGLIEELNTLAVQLMDQYGPESDDGGQREMPYLKRVAQASSVKQAAASDVVRLVTVAHSAEEARDLLASIVAKLMQRHEQIYAGTIDPLRRRLAVIDGEIAQVMAQVKELGNLGARLRETQPAQASLVAMERGRLYVELGNLERDRMLLQRQVINPYSSPSKVIAPATLPDGPAAPAKFTIIVSGIVLGLVLGVFVVFFREFFGNAPATRRPDMRT